ncbi:MAG: phosphoglycerate dehydrogenase [Archangiaceae bacterium]|nr:phosphoglycerate dehydrogenase [Archangiaceae bacterium]
MKVLLLENIHAVGHALLEAEGFEVERADGALKEEELVARIGDFDLVGIRSKTKITPRVLEAAKRLIGVGAFCIGTNQIALSAAVKRGVCVFNAPFSNTRSVAELVLAEIVMLSRQLGDRSREVHAGAWKKVATGSHEVRGKTLGIVGYGHIGTQVGLLAEFFGMRVVYFDVAARLPLGNVKSEATLEKVLEQSDFVTLHVPETPQTQGMMGEKQLQAMKKGSCLLNLSRGTVVDLDALASALKTGHLAGAAVDVYPEEPEGNVSSGFKSPLQGLANVVLTPHIGGSTLEAQEAIGREVATTLVRFVRSGASSGSVNFPQVELGPTPGTARVVHVHQNVPGVLRDVNRIVSDQGANIHAQVLSTSADIGYLIMDLDQPVGAAVCDAMRKLPTTLSARAL